jgi:hypothetical protein
VEKFLSFRKSERQREEEQLSDKRHRLKEQNQRNSAKFLLCCCYGRPHEWLSVICLILTTILSVLKLDDIIDASWGVIMIPMYLIMLQIFGAPIIYDILSSIYKYYYDHELEPDNNPWCAPIFFFLLFVVPIQEGKNKTKVVMYPLMTSFLLFLILFFIRINHPDALPWWGVFLPLLVALLLVSIIPLMVGYGVFSDRRRFDRILPSILTLVLIVFVVFLFLKLDETIDWNWYQVMIPLWVLESLLVVIPPVLSILTFIFDRADSYWLDDRTRWTDDVGPFCITSLIFSVLVITPLLTFQVLLAQYLENDLDTTYAMIFIPLFVLEGKKRNNKKEKLMCF